MTDKERNFVLSVIPTYKRLELDEELTSIKETREVPQEEIDLIYLMEAYFQRFHEHFSIMCVSDPEKTILECLKEGKKLELEISDDILY